MDVVLEAGTGAGWMGPTDQPLPTSGEIGYAEDNESRASVAWTTSVFLDVMLLTAVIMCGLAAIVFTVWPQTDEGGKLLTRHGPTPKVLTD